MIEKEKWLLRSVILNVILALSKLTIGFISQNSLVLADGIHSVSDIVSSAFILISIKISGRKSERFPYGLHKVEDLASLIGGLIILYAAFYILKGALAKNHHLTSIFKTAYLMIFLTAVLLSQLTFAILEHKASKKLNSPGVKTDLLDWLLDAGSTTIALLGILMHRLGIPYAQRAAMVIISIIIAKEALGNIKNSLFTLLDASIDKEIINKAKSIILSHPAVDNLKSIYIRRAGSIYIADITLQIKERNILVAHDTIDEIEKKLKEEIPGLEVITLHYEPATDKPPKKAILLDKNGEIARRMRDVAKIKVITKTTDGKDISYTIDNRLHEKGKGHSLRLLTWLVKEDINEVVFDPINPQGEGVKLFEMLGITVENKLSNKTIDKNKFNV